MANGMGHAPGGKGSHGAKAQPEFRQLSGSFLAGVTGSHEEAILMIEFLKDLWGFMRERKKFWLAPIIILLLLLGALIVFGQGSVVAPFIYTLF